MPLVINLVGQRFGRWIVLHRIDGTSPPRWMCRCDCGTVRDVNGACLRDGHSTSCRCIGAQRFRELDQRGERSPIRRMLRARHGVNFVEPTHPWYKRANGTWRRCKADGIEFGFDSVIEMAAYLISIAPTHCPVFGFKLRTGAGSFSPDAPSTDRIDPTKGYVRGNIQIISLKANTMKSNASPEELRAFALWVLKVKRKKGKNSSPLPSFWS